jgi:uncharacterized protein YjbI with pentapeptide repeats
MLRRGLALVTAGRAGKGLRGETTAWAQDLADGLPVTPAKARLMRAWFARHGAAKAEGARRMRDPESPAAVAWLLWGGDPSVPYRRDGWSDPVAVWLRSLPVESPKRRRAGRIANPTRYARETGKPLPRWREKLAQYAKDGGYFVHFSNVPKAGLYPTNKFDTPTGFYAYSLSFDDMSDFATERPYAIVFKPVHARLWNLGKYSTEEYRADLAKLEAAFGGESGRIDIDEWLKGARVRTRAGQMWNVTRHLAGKNVARWTQILYSVLGYDGVVDKCDGIIHHQEPCQAVFFDTRTGTQHSQQNAKIKIVDILSKGTSKTLQDTSPRENLSRQDLSSQNLYERNFKLAIAIDTSFAGSYMESVNFAGAKLIRANLSGTNLIRARLDDADLTGASLVRATLVKSNMYNANLTRATLRWADLSGVTLRGANLTEADLTGAKMTGVDFGGAILRRAILSSVDLRGANLFGLDLFGANLTRANLRDAFIDGADLRGADLRGADLRGAEIRKTDLRGADLRTARNIDSASFDYVIHDRTTRWPTTFSITQREQKFYDDMRAGALQWVTAMSKSGVSLKESIAIVQDHPPFNEHRDVLTPYLKKMLG